MLDRHVEQLAVGVGHGAIVTCARGLHEKILCQGRDSNLFGLTSPCAWFHAHAPQPRDFPNGGKESPSRVLNRRGGMWFMRITGKKTVGRRTSARAKEEWLYDVSWSWGDASSPHGQVWSREKSPSLTLSMTHNPTRISLIRSAKLVQKKRSKANEFRSRFWLELFHDLQRKILIHEIQAV